MSILTSVSKMWVPLLCLAALVTSAHAHGRVIDPPSRASAWRFGFDTAPNYDDDGLNCGGFAVQWSVNGGRCGICGDPYQAPSPRPHELGGTFGQGVIVAKYLPGSILTTTVDLTTSHRGFWQFKLCPDPESNSQRCFDKNILELEDGGTKFYPQEGSKKYEVRYRLPEGMVCEHCVLQWRYTAGNNWGDCRNGTQALGCGNQEQFGACSDISIGSSKSFDNGESEEEKYPLFYYIKNGYLDKEQDNKKNQNRPQQQLLTDQKHEKPPKKHRPNKKPNKNKPSQKPNSNYPTNSHQNYIETSQKIKDTQKHPQYREKPNIIIQDSNESNKNTQPFLGEWLSNYLNAKEKIESQKKLQQKQKLSSQKPKPQSQKQKPPSQKQKPSPQNWQLDYYEGFLEKPWTPDLQPAYFELDHHKVTKSKTHRKPRLKQKGPKKISKWGKLFYGLWR